MDYLNFQFLRIHITKEAAHGQPLLLFTLMNLTISSEC